MKKDNKGFLLAESLVVSTLVLTIIIFLFTQFKNVVVSQKRSYIYNSVEDIYTLGAMSDFLKANEIEIMQNGYLFENNNCTSVIPEGELKTKCQNIAQSMNVEYIIFTDSDLPGAKNYLKSLNVGQDLIDFVSRIDDPKIDFKGRLFAKFKNGNFATIVIEKDPIPRMKSFVANESFWATSYKGNITTVDFLNEINIPAGVTSWDVSENGNQAVMAWIVPVATDNTKYKLYVAGDRGVVANENSSYLFNGFSNLTSINFNNNFDTSSVTNMESMFTGCSKLTSLDLGDKFDTSHVTKMSNMFNGCTELTKIYTDEKFVTAQVTEHSAMFTGCNNLVGGNGTAVSTKKVYDKTYAKIDKTGQLGYFTLRG